MQRVVPRTIPPLAAALAVTLGCVADTTGLDTVGVEELARRLVSDRPPRVCDANNAKTRRKEGVIPGAVLLSSYRDYDPRLELGADLDRELVFYCHSPRCGAAADAARRALAAGYRRVAVLPAGITGWADAGRPVQWPPDGSRS